MSVFVYVMPEVNGPTCKVGRSKNPEARRKRVQREWGTEVTLFAAVPCDGQSPEHMEAAAHMFLAAEGLHDHHEWFKATPQQALWAIYLARKFCALRYRENGNFKWSRKQAPLTEEAFPLFHNASTGYWDLPVWRRNYGHNC